MTKVDRLLPSTEQLEADAKRGRFIDRAEEYLPDSLYRAKPATGGRGRTHAANGRARSVNGTEQYRALDVKR